MSPWSICGIWDCPFVKCSRKGEILRLHSSVEERNRLIVETQICSFKLIYIWQRDCSSSSWVASDSLLLRTPVCAKGVEENSFGFITKSRHCLLFKIKTLDAGLRNGYLPTTTSGREESGMPKSKIANKLDCLWESKLPIGQTLEVSGKRKGNSSSRSPRGTSTARYVNHASGLSVVHCIVVE